MTKLLGIPTIIWILQLLYVACALVLFTLFYIKFNEQTHRLSFQVVYVLVMIAINIVWRVAIKKLKPEWFQ